MKPTLLKYFFQRIATTVSILWLALVTVVSLYQVLSSREDGLAEKLILDFLQVPLFAMETLPFACIIGGTIVVRRMVADGEMIALRTAGLTSTQIVLFNLIVALFFALCYLVISEVFLPAADNLTRTIKSDVHTTHGIWLYHDGDYIRADNIHTNGQMESILIYHTKKHLLRAITTADRADYLDNQWWLYNTRTINLEGTPQEYLMAKQPLTIALRPSSLSAFLKKPRYLSIHESFLAAIDVAATGQKNQSLKETIWYRLLLLPALPFLVACSIWFINDNRQRSTTSLSVLTAMLIGGIYFATHRIAVQTAVLTNFFPIAFLPLLLLIAVVIKGSRQENI